MAKRKTTRQYKVGGITSSFGEILGHVWTDEAAAVRDLDEYKRRVMADDFLSWRTRTEHCEAAHIVYRDVTDWTRL